MLKEERHRRILELLAAEGRVVAAELQGLLGVSAYTVRRDLDELHARGLIERHHGGASATGSDMLLTWPARSASRAEEKQRIGRVAAGLVPEGSTILVTGGTTTEAMLPHLAQHRALTVVTNSFVVANRLAHAEHVELVVLGGVLRRREMTTLGHLTVAALAELCIDQVFTGAYAIDAEGGVSRTNLTEIQTDRALLAAGRRLVVLADGSKFGRPASARLASVDQLGTVVTDASAPPSQLARLRERGVEILLA